MFDIRPAYTPAPSYRPHINLGGCFDIPTGKWIPGLFGEYILNGGAGLITGFIGGGNLFKSSFHDHVINRLMVQYHHALASKYDTEASASKDRSRETYASMKDLKEIELAWLAQGVTVSNPYDEGGRFTFTDKTRHTGDEHYEKMKDFLDAKMKAGKKYETNLPFLDPATMEFFRMLYPTADGIDSLSEWQTKENVTTADERIGDKKGNMLFARGGLEKSRLLGDIPSRLASAGHFLVTTAHLGKAMNMEGDQNPPKVLQHIQGDLKLKGVAEKFTFISNVCWQMVSASVMKQDDTREVLYPRSSEDSFRGDTDLTRITAKLVRNKNGPSGVTIWPIVSQFEGFLPSLTEFDFIKTNERFGLVGSIQNYVCALAPHHKLSRTSVRRKLDQYADLRRAINICSEMLQCYLIDPLIRDLVMPPEKLYETIAAQGYDWAQLLATRGWYTADNHLHPIPYLSTVDLLRMAHGLYHPYWLAEDKRTVLPPEKFVKNPAPFLKYEAAA